MAMLLRLIMNIRRHPPLIKIPTKSDKIPNFIKIAIFQHFYLKITAKHEQTWYQCLILGMGYRGQKSQIWAHVFFKLPPRMRNTNQKKIFKNIDLKMSLSEGDWETPRFCLKMDENDQ